MGERIGHLLNRRYASHNSGYHLCFAALHPATCRGAKLAFGSCLRHDRLTFVGDTSAAETVYCARHLVAIIERITRAYSHSRDRPRR